MQLVSDPLVDALTGLETRRVEGPGGRTVRVGLVAPKLKRGQKPKGSVIVSPGRTEAIEKHAETARDLVARGFCVLLIDQRGQGWSDRLSANPMAGHMDSFADAAAHLGLAVAACADRLPGPRLMLCHSMGGAIGLEALLAGHLPGLAGAAFSAPMWGLHAIPAARQIAAGLVAMGQGEAIAPTTPKTWVPEPFEGNLVTHDPARFARANALFLAEPAIQIAGPTNGWVHGAYALMDGFRPERLATLSLPVLIVSGEADRVVDNRAHVRIAGQIPGALYRAIPGAKHELLNERDDFRTAFWAHFDAWAEEALQTSRAASDTAASAQA